MAISQRTELSFEKGFRSAGCFYACRLATTQERLLHALKCTLSRGASEVDGEIVFSRTRILLAVPVSLSSRLQRLQCFTFTWLYASTTNRIKKQQLAVEALWGTPGARFTTTTTDSRKPLPAVSHRCPRASTAPAATNKRLIRAAACEARHASQICFHEQH